MSRSDDFMDYRPVHPESEDDFLLMPFARTHCIKCSKQFSHSNTHTKAGWAETQISGLCEDCFDSLFEEDEDEV